MRSRSGKLRVGAAVVLCALVALVALTARGPVDGAGGQAVPTTQAANSEDNEFREQPADIDLSIVNEAKFISVSITRQGASTSYMMGAGDQGFAALTRAVAAAKPVDQTMTETGCTMTFVFSDRMTVSFNLDTSRWLLSRGRRCLQPGPELVAAVSAMEERGR